VRFFPGNIRRIVCILPIVMTMVIAARADNETVEWVVADRPTSYILDGPDKGKGSVDELYALLFRNLPGYEHKTTNMTFGRVLQTMKSGQNLCAVGFKDPEREEVAYFSIPAIISLPFSVVAKKGRIEQFYGDVDSISIEKLLANRWLRGGVMQKRSYGDIDDIIKKYENRRVLHTLTPNSDIVQMLLSDKLDYVIEIVSFAKYRAKHAGKEKEITSFPIREYRQPVLVAHVFCTKNEWGRQMIQKINQIIRRERASPAYIEFMERWYDDRSRRIIRKYYNENFIRGD
jgi:polar amino acid transport system substrate-binding protein